MRCWTRPIARRPIDDHTTRLEFGTKGVNIVDSVGQMAEIAPAFIVFFIPIMRQLDER